MLLVSMQVQRNMHRGNPSRGVTEAVHTDAMTENSGWPPIEPTDGWALILIELHRDLERIDPSLVVRQVKQKGGTLSVWVEASDPALADVVHERIAEAEELSARTCERCGEPGWVRQRSDGWYQALCDEHAAEAGESTVEVPTDPVTTVGELRTRLEGVPDALPLLTDAYEGGYTTIASVTVTEVQELNRHGEQDYLGHYELVDGAQRQAAEPPGGSPWNPIADFVPPTLVGEPFIALILRREGR